MTRPYFFLLLLWIASTACQDTNTNTPPTSAADTTTTSMIPSSPSANEQTAPAEPSLPQELPVPDGYQVLEEATGDLNKDGTPEKVIVYDTPQEEDFGTVRVIHIYRLQDNAWQLWHQSSGAVLPSDHGGTLGDPFEGVTIENGSIVLDHFGGSRIRWQYTHRFRYQNNDWQLIGATITNGAPCDYWEKLDYNLSTGNALYSKEVEACDEENPNAASVTTTKKEFKNKLKSLPSMDGFYPGNNEIKVPELDVLFYF